MVCQMQRFTAGWLKQSTADSVSRNWEATHNNIIVDTCRSRPFQDNSRKFKANRLGLDLDHLKRYFFYNRT